MRRRRKRKINFLPLEVALLFVLGCILVVVLLTGFGIENKVEENVVSEGETKETLAEGDGGYVKKYVEIISKSEQYPDEIISLLNKNSETLDFVYDYLEKRMTNLQKA